MCRERRDAAGVTGAVEAGAGAAVMWGCAEVVGLPVCATDAPDVSARKSSAAAVTRCFEDMATM